MISIPRLSYIPDDVWIYNDFLDKKLHQSITQYLHGYKNNVISNFSGKTTSFDGKTYRIINGNVFGVQKYHQLWYLPQMEDYWKQTNETIGEWAEQQYRGAMHPAFRVLIQEIIKTSPFNRYKGKWIAIRGIFNLFPPGESLDPHIDGMYYIMDCEKNSTYSAIYYSDVEGEGGEYWDDRGFIHKPTNNSLMINDGGKWMHGVRKTTRERLGIVIRFIRDCDLILPGNIEELLYKPSF